MGMINYAFRASIISLILCLPVFCSRSKVYENLQIVQCDLNIVGQLKSVLSLINPLSSYSLSGVMENR